MKRINVVNVMRLAAVGRWSSAAVVMAAAIGQSLVHADTAPQDLLAMIPAKASAAIIIPNLKYCSDEITRCLEGLDRANLLLGSRPLDQAKSATGYNVGINDIGGGAAIWMPEPDGQSPAVALLLPVSDGQAFLSGNFNKHGEADAYETAAGKTYHARLISGYALVSSSAAAVAAIADAAATPDADSPWKNLGDVAAATMAKGEIVMVASPGGVRQLIDRASRDRPELRDEPSLQQAHRLVAPMIDDLRISIVTIDFDPLGLVMHSLAVFAPESAMAKLFAGGTNAPATALTRLPQKPYYTAMSIDVGGLGGSGAMAQLAKALGLSAPAAWISHVSAVQFAAYPSPAGFSGGLLNDAIAVLQTDQPAALRDAIKAAMIAMKNRDDGIKCEVAWIDDKPVKTSSGSVNADQYEVKVIDAPPEQAMQQMISQALFGRAGWKGFVKPVDTALVMTFSQRPAVLEAALNVQPAKSIGSSGVIKTMHKWMAAHNDVEAYLNIGQLSQMARQAAQTFGAAENLPVPEFEANAPPIGLAAEIDQGNIQGTAVIPAAILAPLIDQWTGLAMRRGANATSQPKQTPSSLPGERP